MEEMDLILCLNEDARLRLVFISMVLVRLLNHECFAWRLPEVQDLVVIGIQRQLFNQPVVHVNLAKRCERHLVLQLYDAQFAGCTCLLLLTEKQNSVLLGLKAIFKVD